MPNARHIGRAGLDDDKKLDFASPDARWLTGQVVDASGGYRP